MTPARDTARRAADSDVTVLLLGESGTGKNVLARAIHGWSARRGEPFVTVSWTTPRRHPVRGGARTRQDGARAGDPRLERAPRRTLRHRLVYDARRAPARERAVRTREGRV